MASLQALGDVRAHGLARFHAVEGHRARGHFHVDRAPVLALVLHAQHAGARLRAGGPQGFDLGVPRVRRPQVGQAQGEQLAARVAVGLGHGLVDRQKRQALVGREHPHGLRVRLEQALVLALRQLQLRRHIAQLEQRADRFAQDFQVRQVAFGKRMPRVRPDRDGAHDGGIAPQRHRQLRPCRHFGRSRCGRPAGFLGAIAAQRLPGSEHAPRGVRVGGDPMPGAPRWLASRRDAAQATVFKQFQACAHAAGRVQRGRDGALQQFLVGERRGRQLLLDADQHGVHAGFVGRVLCQHFQCWIGRFLCGDRLQLRAGGRGAHAGCAVRKHRLAAQTRCAPRGSDLTERSG